jgi:protein TonB
MNRYFKSFIIASLVYTSVFASFLFDFDKKTGDAVQKHSYQKINLQNYTVARPEPKPQVQPKPKPTPQKPQKIVKPEPVKPKKVIKKEVVQKVAQVQKEVVKEEIIESKPEQKTPNATPTPQKQVVDTTNVIQKRYSVKEKEIFLNYIRQSIEKNKQYPKVAQRRGVEGKVEVQFTVCERGTLQNLQTNASHKYFDETTKAAIATVFPLHYDLKKVKLPMQLNLVVEYKLR